MCCEDDFFPIFTQCTFFFQKVCFLLPICLPCVIMWIICNEDKCCVVTQHAADIRVVWLLYVRTYGVPRATLNQNKRTRLLYLGDAQIITWHVFSLKCFLLISCLLSKAILISSRKQDDFVGFRRIRTNSTSGRSMAAEKLQTCWPKLLIATKYESQLTTIL